jgi:hypothetical protein
MSSRGGLQQYVIEHIVSTIIEVPFVLTIYEHIVEILGDARDTFDGHLSWFSWSFRIPGSYLRKLVDDPFSKMAAQYTMKAIDFLPLQLPCLELQLAFLGEERFQSYLVFFKLD